MSSQLTSLGCELCFEACDSWKFSMPFYHNHRKSYSLPLQFFIASILRYPQVSSGGAFFQPTQRIAPPSGCLVPGSHLPESTFPPAGRGVKEAMMGSWNGGFRFWDKDWYWHSNRFRDGLKHNIYIYIFKYNHVTSACYIYIYQIPVYINIYIYQIPALPPQLGKQKRCLQRLLRQTPKAVAAMVPLY